MRPVFMRALATIASVGSAVILVTGQPALALPRIHFRLIHSELDALPGGKNYAPVPQRSCPPNCDAPQNYGGRNRLPGTGLVLGMSGHYPLVRFLKLSVAPFVEGGAFYTPTDLDGKMHYAAWAGAEVWYWILGGRLMVGPSVGAAWFRGQIAKHMGGGLSWCLSCSVPEDAGAFRRSLDRIVLKRSGTFREGQGGLERYELGIVLRPDVW